MRVPRFFSPSASELANGFRAGGTRVELTLLLRFLLFPPPSPSPLLDEPMLNSDRPRFFVPPVLVVETWLCVRASGLPFVAEAPLLHRWRDAPHPGPAPDVGCSGSSEGVGVRLSVEDAGVVPRRNGRRRLLGLGQVPLLCAWKAEGGAGAGADAADVDAGVDVGGSGGSGADATGAGDGGRCGMGEGGGLLGTSSGMVSST
jgi:hypothetical protein